MLRRHFIIGAAGTVATLSEAAAQAGGRQSGDAQGAAGTKPLPGYTDWKNADALIVHSNNTLETKRDAFGTSNLTPARDLYVRNNLPPPDDRIVKEADDWQLSIEGVAREGSMTLRDLKRLGIETVAAVLQCSGNGRAFFEHDASGTQWSVGAAGNVIWSGVPIRAIADARGGVVSGRRFITGTGGENLPAGIDPKTVVVERSVPLDAMNDAILAWELNGAPVPVAHGGPLRLIIPGYFGVNNVKYVRRLAFTEQESDAAIQRTGYRIRPVGQRGAPNQPSMWQMPPKSWVTHPLREASGHPVQIHGVAFGGIHGLKGVEVSVDEGRSWQQARLIGPDLGRYAWRTFLLPVDIGKGRHVVASRATNEQGEVQPESFDPNERGYGHNGWRAHAVEVTVL